MAFMQVSDKFILNSWLGFSMVGHRFREARVSFLSWWFSFKGLMIVTLLFGGVNLPINASKKATKSGSASSSSFKFLYASRMVLSSLILVCSLSSYFVKRNWIFAKQF